MVLEKVVAQWLKLCAADLKVESKSIHHQAATAGSLEKRLSLQLLVSIV